MDRRLIKAAPSNLFESIKKNEIYCTYVFNIYDIICILYIPENVENRQCYSSNRCTKVHLFIGYDIVSITNIYRYNTNFVVHSHISSQEET